MVGKFYNSYKEFVEKIQTKKIALFGAGHRCMEVLSHFYSYPYDDISMICDNAKTKWGNKIYDISVCSPDVLAENPEDYVVLIAVDSSFMVKRIERQLMDMGVVYYYHVAILYAYANTAWRYELWKRDSDGRFGIKKFHELNTYHLIESNMDKIQKVRKMLCDEKSVKLYDIFVEKLKYNEKHHEYLTDNYFDHYFSDGIFKYSNNEILVDGGALDGDDAIWFSEMLEREKKVLKKVYCFEPDEINFQKTYNNLEKYFKLNAKLDEDRNKAISDRFEVFRAGLFNEERRIGFCAYGSEGSRMPDDEELGSSVQAVKLDSIIKEDTVTFIKFDLEGCEVAAIKGAKETIIKNKPKLALCIYHNVEDLWEIPLLIKEYVPEYKFFVRHHNMTIGDKILYAAIDEDLL